jgi:hypothetical protein
MARDMEGLVKLTEELTFTSRMHLLDPMVPPVFYKDEVSNNNNNNNNNDNDNNDNNNNNFLICKAHISITINAHGAN